MLNTEYKCIMKVRKLGQQHNFIMKIGETFSHHPMVHTEWFNFIHALNIIFLCFGVMNQKQGKQISNQGQNQFKTKFFLTRAYSNSR